MDDLRLPRDHGTQEIPGEDEVTDRAGRSHAWQRRVDYLDASVDPTLARIFGAVVWGYEERYGMAAPGQLASEWERPGARRALSAQTERSDEGDAQRYFGSRLYVSPAIHQRPSRLTKSQRSPPGEVSAPIWVVLVAVALSPSMTILTSAGLYEARIAGENQDDVALTDGIAAAPAGVVVGIVGRVFGVGDHGLRRPQIHQPADILADHPLPFQQDKLADGLFGGGRLRGRCERDHRRPRAERRGEPSERRRGRAAAREAETGQDNKKNNHSEAKGVSHSQNHGEMVARSGAHVKDDPRSV